MKNREMMECIEALANHYQWRYVKDAKEVYGMHRGVGFQVSFWDGIVTLLFFAPGANVGDEILQGFSGFQHFAEAGLPTSWLKGRTEDDYSCYVQLDGEQLASLGAERWLAIPEIVSQDFHAHGAPENLPCPRCGGDDASEVAAIDYKLTVMCVNCWLALAKQAPTGRIAAANLMAPPPVSWAQASQRLVLAGLVAAAVWSLALHAIIVHYGGAVGHWIFAVPLGLGIAVAVAVLHTGTAVNWLLTLALTATVGAAVFIGNFWGFYVLVRVQQPDLSWAAIVLEYVLFQLWSRDSFDLVFIGAGLIGTWATLFSQRCPQSVRFR